jgi:hypothetical protein
MSLSCTPISLWKLKIRTTAPVSTLMIFYCAVVVALPYRNIPVFHRHLRYHHIGTT